VLWDNGNLYDRQTRRFKNPEIGKALSRIAATGRS
jgi:hypothetical protein